MEGNASETAAKKKFHLPLYLLKLAVFITLTVFILGRINEYLAPKSVYQNSAWPTTSTYYGFYQMKKDTVDVLFLGSSYVVNAFCPQELYNTYGIRSYNLGSEQQSIFLSYYWLKEALRYQHPKAVVVDLRNVPDLNPGEPLNMNVGLVRKAIDPMRWSPVKLEIIRDILRLCPTENGMSFYLNNMQYHDRWASGMQDTDFRRELYRQAPLKGWDTMLYYGVSSFEPYEPTGSEERAEVSATQKEYLYRIGDLCEQNGIQLILVDIPGNLISDGLYNTYQDIAEDLHAGYYDFCIKEWYDRVGLQLPLESILGHSNYWGSVKITRFLGEILQEEYGIPSVTDEQYESTKAFYAEVQKDANLQYVTDFDEYLAAIADPDYTIFFSICEEGSASLTQAEMDQLRRLGIETDLLAMTGGSWCAVVDPDAGVKEAVSTDGQASLDGRLGEQLTTYTISSNGSNSGSPASSTNIGGQEYSQSKRGINIVVYDNLGRSVVDSVTFDTAGTKEASRSWFTEMDANGISKDFMTRW